MSTLEWSEVVGGLVRVTVAVIIGFYVHRMPRWLPWPTRQRRLRFGLIHLIAAPASGLMWYLLSSGPATFLTGRSPEAGIGAFIFIASYAYAIVAGAGYMADARARLVRVEAAAAQTELAALRSQLQPHFLFNALHTVVQLIPIDPNRAMDAAELVAELLRTTLEERRDAVTLRDEWIFVSRYVDLQKIRFGDRLRVRADVKPELLDTFVPSYALQTLVENAVVHGAAPRIEPTDIIVTATGTRDSLTLCVRNNCDGTSKTTGSTSVGTGLNRLQDRLSALHGNAARLTRGKRIDGDYEATLILPRRVEA